MKFDLSKYIISSDMTLAQALLLMDAAGEGFMAVCSGQRLLLGTMTDGDVRRALLQGKDLQTPISEIYNSEFIYIEKKTATNSDVKKMFESTYARQLPVCDNGILVDIMFEERFLTGKQTVSVPQINDSVPVVIMAGGRGTRMAPFTHILPKPLIPVGERAMIEVIMDEYVKFGLSEFYISINDKARIIKAYFDEHSRPQKISFVEEGSPLGTAGALKLLEGQLNRPFFVSNCDVIIHANYNEIYDFHLAGEYDLTIVASMQHHTVPYGVCELETDGSLKSIDEKPQYDFLVNTGMYVLNPSALEFIPDQEFYHITHLVDDLMKAGKNVGVFSVAEQSYVDVGQWDEYRNALQSLSV